MIDTVDGAFESFQSLKGRGLDFIDRELPPETNESIERLIDAFVIADPREREEIAARVECGMSFIFDRYARLAAVGSVRRSDPDLLRRGLIALAIENAKPDWRDTLAYLAFIYRSAGKLNVNASELFHAIAQIACPPFRRLLEGFLGRDEVDRTIESFHWKETGEGETFAYVYVQPPAKRRRSKMELKLDRFLRRLRSAFPGVFDR